MMKKLDDVLKKMDAEWFSDKGLCYKYMDGGCNSEGSCRHEREHGECSDLCIFICEVYNALEEINKIEF